MAALFCAKRIDDETVEYTSRRTGRTYHVGPDIAEYGNFGLVAKSDNLEILSSNRAELLSLIEVADEHLGRV